MRDDRNGFAHPYLVAREEQDGDGGLQDEVDKVLREMVQGQELRAGHEDVGGLERHLRGQVVQSADFQAKGAVGCIVVVDNIIGLKRRRVHNAVFLCVET